HNGGQSQRADRGGGQQSNTLGHVWTPGELEIPADIRRAWRQRRLMEDRPRRRYPSYGSRDEAFQEINFREFETFP
ncbi:hypothetical protein QIH10_28465, partial [Klebsiella pneumoniae]|nr:hypothetical protein [Klebsiella pneumoniae]